jgi:hypothetical protein
MAQDAPASSKMKTLLLRIFYNYPKQVRCPNDLVRLNPVTKTILKLFCGYALKPRSFQQLKLLFLNRVCCLVTATAASECHCALPLSQILGGL